MTDTVATDDDKQNKFNENAINLKNSVNSTKIELQPTTGNYMQHKNNDANTVLFAVDNLTVNSRNKQILHIDQLTIKKQQLTTFIGPNGAGKSTLLHCILNQNSSSGLTINGTINVASSISSDKSATYNNKQPSPSGQLKLEQLISQGKVAWVGQHEQFELPLTVVEYALLGVSPQLSWYQTPNQQHLLKANQLLQEFELLNFANMRIQTLSGGEKQRLAVVRALMQNTEILMLDEPTNHLDIRHQRFLLAYLKKLVTQQQKTIIMVLHDLTHAYQYSDYVVLMSHGKAVLQGPVQTVMTAENLSPIYQVDIKTYDTDSGRLFV